MKVVAAMVVLLGAMPAQAAPGKMRVAVLDFENTGGDRGMDALGKGLQSMFMTDLGQVGALQIVERARLSEVQRELKLGRSRGFDPKTAARVGKLAGASHLVTGTFTIAGKRMRMDCRLFAVEDGTVLLAEKSEGEADGFFEVQKGLVKKVLDTVAVRIEPKERAALMRVQTADLGALTAFSNGLALADDKRYEEALEAIKEARRRDQDFKLAETTQAEYERVVAELRTEAVALSVRDRATTRSKTAEATRVESAALGQLFAYAAKKGDGAREERVAALSALAGWLSAARPQPSAPPAIPDRFTKNCMADSAMQNYLAEALRLYPKVPLVPERPELDLVLHQDTFAAAFKKQVERTRAPQRRTLFPSVGEVRQLVDRLRLLPADRADFHHRLYKMVLSVGPPAEWKAEHLSELGFSYRQATQFDRSTEFFKQAAEASTGNQRARALQDAADEIELNKKLSAALKAATSPAQREYVQAAVRSRGYEVQGLSERNRDPERIRRFPVSQAADDSQFHGPLFLGKHPVWQFALHEHALISGPRRDGLRTSELRYFWDQRAPPWSENLAVLDCTPRKDLSARFTLSFSPPEDFNPRKVPAPGAEAVAAGLDPRRPAVGWLFGVNHPECCEATGYAVMFLPDAVRLVQLNQNPIELKAKDRYAKKVLEERKVDLGDPGPHKASIKIAGGTIAVEVGGKKVELRAPGEREGYYGLYFGGHGYASAGDLSVSGP
jgi:TolB-like protein/tetratricopeptide (TPR) repeat protein